MDNKTNVLIEDLKEITMLCMKIVKLSRVLKNYKIKGRGDKLSVRFANEINQPMRYVSGNISRVKTDLKIILYGLEEVNMRETYHC